MSTVELPEAYHAVMRPSERATVSEWCDKRRVLSDKFGAEKTQWSTARTPYLREPLDAFADPTVGSICLLKCSRVGGSEWMNNVLAWSARNRPMPALYVLPTQLDVEDEFTGRIKSIFEDSPDLAALQAGNDWAKVDPPLITLETMRIYGGWASAPGTLIRRTIGIVLFDELDNCDAAAGRLGNTLQLVSDRLTTFGYRSKLVAATTPTTTAGSGWRMYQESDQRRYFVPCPHCGQYQLLLFAGLTIPPDVRDPDVIESQNLATYQCEACRQQIQQTWQRWMVERGVWVPACQKITERLPVGDQDTVARAAMPDQGRGILQGVPPSDWQWRPRIEGEKPITRNRGYWINSCYSPWRTWSQIMAKFLKVKDDPEQKRVFFNSWMAEPYEETVETTPVEVLQKRIPDGLPEDIIPERAKLLLCGADVQQDFIYYHLRAWGAEEESWLIRHATCATFDELYRIAFHTGFRLAHDPSQRMICTGLAIDSGHRTDEVYAFGKRPGVTVVKGRDNGDFRTKPSKIEYMPRGGAKADSIILYHVNTFLFKTKLHRLAASDRWHFHNATTLEYLKHITAEVLKWKKTKRSGRVKKYQVFDERSPGAANHWLDTETYALALADMLNVPLLGKDSLPRGVMTSSPAASLSSSTAPSSSPPQYGWVKQ